MSSKDHSFDIVSKVDLQEVDNAVVQLKKEMAQRFDFKGSISEVDFNKADKKISIKAENEHRLKTIVEMLHMKLLKRNVSLKALDPGKVETGFAGGSIKQVMDIRDGLSSDKAKEINKSIKEAKIKIQTQIQSDQIRATSPKIDDLQAAIAYLKTKDFQVDLQFVNFR